MDQERARIEADLRGLLEGDVRCDDITRQMYASDASIYEVIPLGVVRPASTEDVVACVQYAAQNQLTLHPRGAGTGVAGESLGRGLIIDFAHSMRRVLSQDDQTVRVQPGVVLAQLNDQLAPQGLTFGPDPATRSVTTMGSVVALDASGSHWMQYGSARDHVEHVQVVLANGEVIEARNVDLKSASINATEYRLAERVADLVERNKETLAQHRPKTQVNRCGYHLYDIKSDDGHLDLAKLFAGSEGTLGLITEATLRVVPRPTHRGVALFFFEKLELAAKAAIEVSSLKAAACDLLDRRLLSLARELDVRYEMMIPAQAEAMLLVEVAADSSTALRERLDQIVNRLRRKRRLAFDARSTVELDERNFYWRLTRRVIPTLYRLRGSSRALPCIEDVAVPVNELPGFLVKMQNVLKAHQVTASFFAHAGHGQLHIRPFLDLSNPEDTRRIEPLARDLYDEVQKVSGTICGEHGSGLSRTWFMKRHTGPLFPIFREVKQIFDPDQIMNPGKVVGDTPQAPSDNLRKSKLAETESDIDSTQTQSKGKAKSDKKSLPVLDLQLRWTPEEIFEASRNCNGCGRCRTMGQDERMCPIFRAQPTEEASPRAKANLMRGILSGSLDASAIETDEFKAIADLCVNCHQCRLECPAGVDIPRLMLEAKAQFVRNNGMKPSNLAMARIDRLVGIAASVRSLSNWAIGNRWMRWVLARAIGVAQGRKLPLVASRAFLKTVARRGLNRMSRSGDRKVLFFVDTFVNWYDPHLAECLISILRHNGISVYVPTNQTSSGMPLISQGAFDRARKIARHNVELLADAVRQGYHVVTAEPAAALCLTHEYPNLLDDEDARLVAENTSEACNYLWKMHQTGGLELDFQPVNLSLGYHLPCHQRALEQGAPGERLLQLIPGVSVRHIDKGCSGMAGTWGLKRENYRRSIRVGWGLISTMRDPSLAIGATECSTCRIQMEQGTNKPTLHPLKILALAYGLHPEVDTLLERRSGDRILTSMQV